MIIKLKIGFYLERLSKTMSYIEGMDFFPCAMKFYI